MFIFSPVERGTRESRHGTVTWSPVTLPRFRRDSSSPHAFKHHIIFIHQAHEEKTKGARISVELTGKSSKRGAGAYACWLRLLDAGWRNVRAVIIRKLPRPCNFTQLAGKSWTFPVDRGNDPLDYNPALDSWCLNLARDFPWQDYRLDPEHFACIEPAATCT